MKRIENAGQKDCAQMWFGPDFRGSLKVQAMSWAEQGMYRHLLDLSWENHGLPSDLDELRGILRLSEQEFAKAWKRIGKCFVPHPDDPARLINERQEKEREIRASIRKRRIEASQRGNEARWGSDNGSDSDAKRTPNGIANASQNGRLSPSPPPSPSPLVPPSPSAPGVPEHSSCGKEQDDRSASSGAAGGRGTEPQRELLEALTATGYRRNSRNRTLDLLEAAERLAAAGIAPRDLLRLAQLAQARGKKPGGLFAHWIDNVPEALKELSKR